jgi:hypothetical protein
MHSTSGQQPSRETLSRCGPPRRKTREGVTRYEVCFTDNRMRRQLRASPYHDGESALVKLERDHDNLFTVDLTLQRGQKAALQAHDLKGFLRADALADVNYRQLLARVVAKSAQAEHESLSIREGWRIIRQMIETRQSHLRKLDDRLRANDATGAQAVVVTAAAAVKRRDARWAGWAKPQNDHFANCG